MPEKEKKSLILEITDRIHNTHPVKQFSSHLVGDDHSTAHKMITGFTVMVVGVCVAKSGHGVLLHYITDLLGYAIHGIGLTPWVDWLIKIIKDPA